MFSYKRFLQSTSSSFWLCNCSAWNRRSSLSLSNCNGIWTHNHVVHKRTFNHLAKLASLAKWLTVWLWTKWLLVRIPLQSVKLSSFFPHCFNVFCYAKQYFSFLQRLLTKVLVIERKAFSVMDIFPVMRRSVWYHLSNFKNVKNTHGGVLTLVKLQAKFMQLY